MYTVDVDSTALKLHIDINNYLIMFFRLGTLDRYLPILLLSRTPKGFH